MLAKAVMDSDDFLEMPSSTQLLYIHLENIEQLELAIRQKKQVSFYYFDLDEKRNRVYRKEKKRYITDPVALVFSEDNYYLVAYSQEILRRCEYELQRNWFPCVI